MELRKRENGKHLNPYDLRDFYTTWMRAHGLSKPDIDLLQGRISIKSIQEEHYLDTKTPTSPFIQSLAAKYRVAMEPLIPKFLQGGNNVF